MGRGRPRTCAGPSRLYDQHRRGSVTRGDFIDRFNKLRPSSEFFQINQNNRSIPVTMKIAQQVKFIHICFVADGNEF